MRGMILSRSIFGRVFAGRHGWCVHKRALHRGLDPDYVAVCKKVIESLPNVLVLPERESRAFVDWQGTHVRLDSEISTSVLLPFVDRLKTVTSMTMAITRNFQQTQQIQVGFDTEERMLQLIGTGALYGAGKTRIGRVVHQCVQRMLGDAKQVVYILSNVTDDKSPYEMWIDDVCRIPNMEGLEDKIHKDMTFGQIVRTTERYLAERNMVMFLHLDEFAPFNHCGRTANTPEQFYRCWKRMLMPILCSPSIGLYISGRMSYYDNIGGGKSGQSPSLALSEQLDLFDASVIHTALEKIAIPSDITGESTVALSKTLDALIPAVPGQALQQRGSWEISQRLHDVTGGVPRFVQYALHALLVNRSIYAALFKHEGSAVISEALLDQLFGSGGDVYSAVADAAEIHFTNIAATSSSKEERDQRVMGLLQLVFLRGRVFQLSPLDVRRITQGRFPLDKGPIAKLISHAQYWGIHRDFNEEKGLITFVLPFAVLDGLAPLLTDLKTVLPDLKDDTKEKDPTGDLSEKKVHAILVFHRILATLLPHSNWLGLQEDSDEPAQLLDLPGANSEPFTPTAHAWDLPCLPIVHPNGQLKSIQEVEKCLAYGQTLTTSASSGDRARGEEDDLESADDVVQRVGKLEIKADEVQSYCPPKLLGEFISSLSSSDFQAFATGARSASADFVVRYGDQVTHLQVKHTEPPSFQIVLKECAKIAPTVEGSPDLQHTVAFVMMKANARATSARNIESLSNENLLQKLEKALQQQDRARARKLKKMKDGKKAEKVEKKKDGRKAEKVEKNKDDEVTEQLEKKAINERLAIKQIKEGKLKVVILDEVQYIRFSRYRELARHLLT